MNIKDKIKNCIVLNLTEYLQARFVIVGWSKKIIIILNPNEKNKSLELTIPDSFLIPFTADRTIYVYSDEIKGLEGLTPFNPDIVAAETDLKAFLVNPDSERDLYNDRFHLKQVVKAISIPSDELTSFQLLVKLSDEIPTPTKNFVSEIIEERKRRGSI